MSIRERPVGKGKIDRQVSVAVLRFPDGGPWAEQEGLVTEVFNVISNEIKGVLKRGR